MSRVMIPVLPLVALLFLAGCGRKPPSTGGVFVGHWWGHTRGMDVTRDGRGREIVDDGCCVRVITLRFRLVKVRGTPSDAVATIRVTFARVDEEVFRELHRRVPRVGREGTLRLQNGVLTDDLTEVTFCAPNVDKCGL